MANAPEIETKTVEVINNYAAYSADLMPSVPLPHRRRTLLFKSITVAGILLVLILAGFFVYRENNKRSLDASNTKTSRGLPAVVTDYGNEIKNKLLSDSSFVIGTTSSSTLANLPDSEREFINSVIQPATIKQVYMVDYQDGKQGYQVLFKKETPISTSTISSLNNILLTYIAKSKLNDKSVNLIKSGVLVLSGSKDKQYIVHFKNSTYEVAVTFIQSVDGSLTEGDILFN